MWDALSGWGLSRIESSCQYSSQSLAPELGTRFFGETLSSQWVYFPLMPLVNEIETEGEEEWKSEWRSKNELIAKQQSPHSDLVLLWMMLDDHECAQWRPWVTKQKEGLNIMIQHIFLIIKALACREGSLANLVYFIFCWWRLNEALFIITGPL